MNNNNNIGYTLDFKSKVKSLENNLDDVMEILDIEILKKKLVEVESNNLQNNNTMNKVRLGIIYHEVVLNLSFFSKSEYKGYARKSFDILDSLFKSNDTAAEFLPFITSYRASALSLLVAENKKLSLLSRAFSMFQDAIDKYASVTAIPEFMRGSVAENLPAIFFSKRRFAKIDFQSIIEKYEKDSNFAHPKLMSFAYWAWANQRQTKKYRAQALHYLDKAITLDPNYVGGRDKSEKLKAKLLQK